MNNVAKALLPENIYPTKDEFRAATEKYLTENYASFYNNLSEKRWIIFYNKNIHQQVILEQFCFIHLKIFKLRNKFIF